MQKRLEEQGAVEGYAAGAFAPVLPASQPCKAQEQQSSSVLAPSLQDFSQMDHNNADPTAARPNYLIGVRVCSKSHDSSFSANVKTTIQNACALQPDLAPGVTPEPMLHITLLMLKLRSHTDAFHVSRAMLDVEKTEQFRALHLALAEGGIPFQEIALLSERVLVAVPGASDDHDDVRNALRQLRNLFKQALESCGLESLLVGNRKDYSPHVTLLKISRAMNKDVACVQTGVNHISSSCFQHLRGVPVGHAHFGGIHLCAMYKPAHNGFYKTELSLPFTNFAVSAKTVSASSSHTWSKDQSHNKFSGGFKFCARSSRWAEDTDGTTFLLGVAGASSSATVATNVTILSLNVLCDRFDKHLVKTEARLPKLLGILQSQNADVICLQEVEAPFLRALLLESWVQERYWSSAVPESKSIAPFGQFNTSTHAHTQSFSCPRFHTEYEGPVFLHVVVLSFLAGQVILSIFPIKSLTCLRSSNNSIKRQIVAELHLHAAVTLLVASAHLSSDYSKGKCVDRAVERRTQLASIKNYFRQHASSPSSKGKCVCQIIAGDFNDNETVDQNSDFVDLWPSLRPNQDAPTYDCKGNELAKILSARGRSFRPDRILVRKAMRVGRTILQLDNIELVNTCDGTLLPASDHHGLLGSLTFRSCNMSRALREEACGNKRLCIFDLQDVLLWKQHEDGSSGCLIPGDAFAAFQQQRNSSHLLLLVKKQHKNASMLAAVCAALGLNPNVDNVDFHFYHGTTEAGFAALATLHRNLIVATYQKLLHPIDTEVWCTDRYLLDSKAVAANHRNAPKIPSFVSCCAVAGGDLIRACLAYTGRSLLPQLDQKHNVNAFSGRREEAMSEIITCWGEIAKRTMQTCLSSFELGKACVVPFGSSCYGRQSSDVDLCLIGGAGMRGKKNVQEEERWMRELANALKLRRGFFVHVGSSAKCPRVRACYAAEDCGTVEFDIVFCSMQTEDVDKYILGGTLQTYFVDKRAAGETIAPSLGGIERTNSFLNDLTLLEENTRGMILPVIEFCCEVFTLAGLHGSTTNGLRTFHLTHMISNYIHDGKFDPKPATSTEFARNFLAFACIQQSAEILFKGVVHEFLMGPVCACFQHCKRVADSIVAIEKSFVKNSFVGIARVTDAAGAGAVAAEVVKLAFFQALYSPFYRPAVLGSIKEGFWHIAVFPVLRPDAIIHDVNGKSSEALWKAQVELNAWFKLFLSRAIDAVSDRRWEGAACEVVANPSSSLRESIKAFRANKAPGFSSCVSGMLTLGKCPLVLKVQGSSFALKATILKEMEKLVVSFEKNTATNKQVGLVILTA
jgi:endonuclease/exonuclease/phosphatase family metal-dependent hydrolase